MPIGLHPPLPRQQLLHQPLLLLLEQIAFALDQRDLAVARGEHGGDAVLFTRRA
jgi:hypothetical protein